MEKRRIPVHKGLLASIIRPKKELVRVTVNRDKNISVDSTGKKLSRGAYVSSESDKIAEAKKNQILEKSLGVKVSVDFYDDLYTYVGHQKARKELFGDR